MIGPPLGQAKPGKPADRQIYPSFAHQPPLRHEARQKPRQPKPQRRLRLHSGPPEPIRLKPLDHAAQPGQVQNSINPNQNMIVRQQVTDRTAHHELKLIPVALPDHQSPQTNQYPK